MQSLRTTAIAARHGLALAADSCSQIPAGDADQLFELYDALIVLGDPTTWRNADGSTKSLADFLGPDQASIFNMISSLESTSSPDLQDQYESAFHQAVAELEALQLKAALARSQLAPWLTP
jgi:hypothetical protein